MSSIGVYTKMNTELIDKSESSESSYSFDTYDREDIEISDNASDINDSLTESNENVSNESLVEASEDSYDEYLASFIKERQNRDNVAPAIDNNGELSSDIKSFIKDRHLKWGDLAYRSKDFTSAIKHWGLCAELGCGISYNRLGLHAIVCDNDSAAVDYFEKAVDNGHYDSLITLCSYFGEKSEKSEYSEYSGHVLLKYEAKLLDSYNKGLTFIDKNDAAYHVAKIHCYHDDYNSALIVLGSIEMGYVNFEFSELTRCECLLKLGLWETLLELATNKTNGGLTEYYYFLVEYANYKGEYLSEAIDNYITFRCGAGLDRMLDIVSKVGRLDEYEMYLNTLDRSTGYVDKCLGDICERKNDREAADKLYHKSLIGGYTRSIIRLIALYVKHNQIQDAIKYYSVAIDVYGMFTLQAEFDSFVQQLPPNMRVRGENAIDSPTGLDCDDSRLVDYFTNRYLFGKEWE